MDLKAPGGIFHFLDVDFHVYPRDILHMRQQALRWVPMVAAPGREVSDLILCPPGLKIHRLVNLSDAVHRGLLEERLFAFACDDATDPRLAEAYFPNVRPFVTFCAVVAYARVPPALAVLPPWATRRERDDTVMREIRRTLDIIKVEQPYFQHRAAYLQRQATLHRPMEWQ